MPDYGQWLVVAPTTELPHSDAEIMEVASALHAEVLIGDSVTAVALQRALRTKRKGVWFITHGDLSGIYLSDGLLPTNLLLPMLEAADPEIVYLNTCKSVHVGLGLQSRLRCAFIANLQDVPDQEAFVSGTAIAHYISQGRSYRSAYNAARPGSNTNLIFLPETVNEIMTTPTQPKSNGVSRTTADYDQMRADLTRLIAEMQRLVILVDGDAKWNQLGLTYQVRLLMEKVDRIESRQLLFNIISAVVAALLVIFFLIMQSVISRGGP